VIQPGSAPLAGVATLVAAVLATAQANSQGRTLMHLAQGLGANQAPDDVSVSVSGDGRFIAFESRAALVADDLNGLADIYLFDRRSAQVVLVSRSFDGAIANGTSACPRVSADGRFVAFVSAATRLVRDDENQRSDVFVWNRIAGTMERVTVSPQGDEATRWSGQPSISADGQVVAFQSSATNLVDGSDANGIELDIYVYRRDTRRMSRMSTMSDGEQPAVGSSFDPALSGDGRRLVFTSSADLGCPRSTSTGRRQLPSFTANIYLKDLETGRIECVSRGMNGRAANGPSSGASINRDGLRIAYVTEATNLGLRDRNHARDIVVQDRRTGRIELVSRAGPGVTANGPSWRPAISSNGRSIAFVSSASDLLCRRRCRSGTLDRNLVADVYLFDTTEETMRRVSTDDTGEWWAASRGPALDSAATLVSFSSSQPVSAGDLSGDEDLFVLTSEGNGQSSAPLPINGSRTESGQRHQLLLTPAGGQPRHETHSAGLFLREQRLPQRVGLFLHVGEKRLEARILADPIQVGIAREQRIAGKAGLGRFLQRPDGLFHTSKPRKSPRTPAPVSTRCSNGITSSSTRRSRRIRRTRPVSGSARSFTRRCSTRTTGSTDGTRQSSSTAARLGAPHAARRSSPRHIPRSSASSRPYRRPNARRSTPSIWLPSRP
jgi:Tol biopolymer transport system component